MPATVAGVFLGPDTHANRPAANAAGQPVGAVYSCTTHGLIYKTDGSTWSTYATLGGSGMSNPMTTSQDIIVGGSSGTPGRLAKGADGTFLGVVSGSLAYATPSAGATFTQMLTYPTSFSGNDWHNSTATTDVSAYSTKEILNSSTVHLQTLGASKDHSTYWTLGSTKAAAFDFRFRFAVGGTFWAAQEDSYFQIAACDSSGTGIAQCRLVFIKPNVVSSPSRLSQAALLRVGNVGLASAGVNTEPVIRTGEDVTLRMTRDGSNNLAFSFGLGGPANLAMTPVLVDSNNVPYAPTNTGTVARIYIQSHTPSGPGSTAQMDFWLDYFDDV